MPQSNTNDARWWYWPANILIGIVAGHFWAVQHIAHQDGRIDASFTGPVAGAVIAGVLLTVVTTKARRYGSAALCVGLIAAGASAALWH